MKSLLTFLVAWLFSSSQLVGQVDFESLSGKVEIPKAAKPEDQIDKELIAIVRWNEPKLVAKNPDKPVELKYSGGKFRPPLLSIRPGQKVALVNDEKVTNTFLYSRFNDVDCFVHTLDAGQKQVVKFQQGTRRTNSIRVIGSANAGLVFANEQGAAALVDEKGKFQVGDVPKLKSRFLTFWTANDGYLSINGKKRTSNGVEVSRFHQAEFLKNIKVARASRRVKDRGGALFKAYLDECFPGNDFSYEEIKIEFERTKAVHELFTLTKHDNKQTAKKAKEVMKRLAKSQRPNERVLSLIAKADYVQKDAEK